MKILTKKSPKDSIIHMRELVMPSHINPQGTIFGGTVMSWIDIAAAMCAAKHCNRTVVTVHVDEISFLSPIKMGYHVLIQATMHYVGRTSMIIGVNVQSENPYTSDIKTTTQAYLTFVALDDDGKPTEVPALLLETEEEKQLFENTKKRVEGYKALRAKLK